MVMGRLRSGAWVTMHGCGEAIPSCASDVRVFCSQAILRTGIWGERLDLQRAGANQMRPVKVPASTGVWQQFMAVRRGEIANPMARLYDAIKASAAQRGQPVHLA